VASARFDRQDAAHPDDVFDEAQLLEFTLRQDRAPVHGGLDGLVDAQQAAQRLEL
jgi:hypothetical protein